MSDRRELLPVRPLPDPRPRSWGGSRFAAGASRDPIGELWIAGPDNLVADPRGPHQHEAGKSGDPMLTLGALAEREGEALVGRAATDLLGPRFPLLVKLIDPADWLSLQIHPDDEQARSIGDGTSPGKREAWFIIDSRPEAQIVAGAGADVDRADVLDALRRGAVPLELLATITPTPGTIVHVPPRTLHSIGPGVFVYEVQQPSDLTLRASDWGREPRPDRPLHIDETLRMIDLDRRAEVVQDEDDGHLALSTDRFRLEVVSSDLELRPAGRTVEIVTPVVGSALVEGDGWLEALEPYQTLVVPAAIPAYSLRPAGGSRVCVASLPDRVEQGRSDPSNPS